MIAPRRQAPGARGQATVELALGGTLVVTLLLLGLYLTEIGYLSLKVQEASASALWEATGRPAHDFQGAADGAPTGAPLRDAFDGPNAVDRRLTQRYQNFNGVVAGGGGTSRLFARGSGLQVTCAQRGTGGDPLSFQLPASTTWDSGGGSTPPQVNGLLRSWYRPAAMSCTSSAQATAVDLPSAFLDRESDGFFSRFREDRAIRLCGAGRAVDGRCDAGYAILLGDWGMDGRERTRLTWNSPTPASYGRTVEDGNVPYRSMVRELFAASGRHYDAGGTTEGPAARFARIVADGRRRARPYPHNEKRFFMSFSGVENGYVDMVESKASLGIPEKCRSCHFNTAGTHVANGNPRWKASDNKNWTNWDELRQPCFLGIGRPNKKGRQIRCAPQ